MAIASDATPEEITAKVAAWFKSVYRKGASIGEIRDVKADDRDRDHVLVTYRHAERDSFAMRRVGSEWYFIIDSRPLR
jgi:hypothetical protein